MTKNEEYTLHYNNPNCILVVNLWGLIRTLYTPFKVRCTSPVADYTIGTVVYVEEVVSGQNDELFYIIGQSTFQHKHFRIMATF